MESMEENQGLKLVDDTSRRASIPNNDKKPNNDDDNNKLGIEENNKPNDTQIKTNEESIAFKLQFDEILIAKKLFENAKSNNNNRYYNSHAKSNSLSSLNNRRISEIENSYFTHQRSYSYQTSLKYHNYHNQAKHKRNNSSVPKLNLNGISNNSYYPTATNRNVKLNSLPSTSYVSYDVFDELSFDDAFGLKSSLKEFDYKFNNNRHDSDWDSLSNGQGYPPLTPSSIHSSSSSFSPSLSPYHPSTKSSYHQHHHWFLDDKEFFAQQLLLEEERKLLEIQQIQLNDAIAAHQLRLKSETNNNNNNFDPLFKFNLVQTPTTPTTPLTPLTPLTPSTPSSLNNNNSRHKPNSFLHHKSCSSSQSLNHLSSSSSSSSSLSPSSPSSHSRYYKEPIGTPVRKPSPSNSNNNHKHNVKPISISTASSSSSSLLSSSSSSSSLSPSSSSSSFSLFSKSPSSSINISNINVNVNLSPTTPPSMPITPPTTPHNNNNNNNNNNSYFNPFSSLNILNPKSKNLNHLNNKHHHHNLFYNNSVSATIFDEREEDSLSWPNESFNKEFERPLQLNNNNLKFHRGHHRHTSELIKLLV